MPRALPRQAEGSDMLTSPHALLQVLLPPRKDVPAGQGLLQQLDSVPAFRLFRELLQVRARGEGSSWSGAPFPRCGGGWPAPRVRTRVMMLLCHSLTLTPVPRTTVWCPRLRLPPPTPSSCPQITLWRPRATTAAW